MSDTTDLQTLINNAISTGNKHIFLEARTYVIDKTGSYWGLRIPVEGAGIQIHGSGLDSTILQEADNTAPSVRTLIIEAPGVTIDNLSFHGGIHPPTDKDEHRAGIYVNAAGLTVRNVASRGYTGDGIYLYTGANDTTLINSVIENNGRHGVTLAASLANIRVTGCRMASNISSQFHIEPPANAVVKQILLDQCVLDAGSNQGYVGTFVGQDIVVKSCEINGGLYFVFTDRADVLDCWGINLTTKPSVTIYKQTSNIRVIRGNFSATNSLRGILVTGTGPGTSPTNISIEDTAIQCGGAYVININAVKSARVYRCTIKNCGIGIYVRATNIDEVADLIELVDNRIESFGNIGILIGGNQRGNPDGTISYANIKSGIIIGNSCGNASSQPPTSVTGLMLDDGTHVLQQLIVGRNISDTTITTPLTLPASSNCYISTIV